MSDRDEIRHLLEAEKQRWAAKSVENLIAERRTVHNYEIKTESGNYQFEVQLLEHRPDYLHVCISIDDGSLITSLVPPTATFTVRR